MVFAVDPNYNKDVHIFEFGERTIFPLDCESEEERLEYSYNRLLINQTKMETLEKKNIFTLPPLNNTSVVVVEERETSNLTSLNTSPLVPDTHHQNEKKKDDECVIMNNNNNTTLRRGTINNRRGTINIFRDIQKEVIDVNEELTKKWIMQANKFATEIHYSQNIRNYVFGPHALTHWFFVDNKFMLFQTLLGALGGVVALIALSGALMPKYALFSLVKKSPKIIFVIVI